MNSIKVIVFATFFIALGYFSVALCAEAILKKPASEVSSADLASPVFFIMKDGKPHLLFVSAVIFTMRSDGTVGWRMSDEAASKMKEEQSKGIKLPPPDYKSSKR
jgi:hypothetical protein